jgi:dihydropteroate synthase
VEQRTEGSLAAHVAAALAGAHVVRAHDVRATVRAVRVADAIRGDPPGSLPHDHQGSGRSLV